MTTRAGRVGSCRLPAEVTSFVGRRRELVEIKRLLESTRLLTLTGAGGCGKSRLALRSAHDLARAFPDGVYLAELASLAEPAVLAHAFFDALDLRDQTSTWPVATLSAYIANKRLLLVVDNCEHLLDACAVLMDAMLRACAELRILATSRHPLSIAGETTYRVPSLSLPEPDQKTDSEKAAGGWRAYESLALFEDRAAAVNPDFSITEANAGVVAELCRRLDGIPLAIELAAVWIRTLSVAQIHERLHDRFRLLSKGSARSAPRHRTLRAAIEWSFGLLSENEQLLWERLSVFPGSFDVEAVVAVAAGQSIAVDDTLDLLDDLVTTSILYREPGEGIARYAMLESVREYGRGLLRKAGRERELRLRHLNWMARLLAEGDTLAGAHQARWLDLIQREQDNFRAALDFCLREQGAAATGLLMLSQSWLHWIARGHLGEARRWLNALLEASPNPSLERARALATLAMVALSGGDARTADVASAECLQLSREVGDAHTTALCQIWAGIAAYMQHDFERSDASLRSAAEAFASMNDNAGLASTQIQLGALAGVRGDLAAAEAILERSRELAAQLDDSWLVARSALTQGSLLAHWGHGARAGPVLRESLQASQTIGDRWAIAVAIELLALVANGEGRAERAAQLLGAAEMLWETAPPAFTPEWDVAREACRADARTQLGEDAFTQATGYGRAMELDGALRLALEQAEPQPAGLRSRRPLAQLSERQLEVAALVAEGLSNKQIAGRLIISERTVDAHLNHILTRLGFNSRAQLAAWHAERAR